MGTLIKRKRGDDYSIFLALSDSAGLPLVLSGTSSILSVSTKKEPITASYVFQVNGVIYGNATDGIYEFPISTLQADNLGRFYYDIEYTDPLGKIRTVEEGTLIFSQDIGK